MEAAMTTAPTMIRYLGWILVDIRPTTNIITIVTTPPGESTRPAQVALAEILLHQLGQVLGGREQDGAGRQHH
jgi:hypothetical protein